MNRENSYRVSSLTLCVLEILLSFIELFAVTYICLKWIYEVVYIRAAQCIVLESISQSVHLQGMQQIVKFSCCKTKIHYTSTRYKSAQLHSNLVYTEGIIHILVCWIIYSWWHLLRLSEFQNIAMYIAERYFFLILCNPLITLRKVILGVSRGRGL